jgi:hypothetical protein
MSFYDVLLKLHEFIYLKLKLCDFATVRNDFFEHQNYFIENKHKITVVSFKICLLSQNISFSSQFQYMGAVQCANLPLSKWFVLFFAGTDFILRRLAISVGAGRLAAPCNSDEPKCIGGIIKASK